MVGLNTMTVFSNAANAKTLAAHFTLGGVDINVALSDTEERPKYTPKTISKRSGEARKLYIPNEELKKAQKLLKTELEKVYNPPACVHGFQKGENIKSGAVRHVGSTHILKFDIQDFFGSITRTRVSGLFRKIFPKKSNDFYRMLLDICIHEGKLPQGSPCSPIISNMIMLRLDNKLMSLCESNRLEYSRYADDITISAKGRAIPAKMAYRSIDIISGKEVIKLGPVLDNLVKENGFLVNDRKTNLIGSHLQMRVTGIVVNKKTNLRKDEIKALRTIIKNIESATNISDGLMNFYNRHFKKRHEKNDADVSYAKRYLRGRFYYLRFIKGDFDPTYRRLAKRYKAIDEDFNFDEKVVNLSHIRIIIRVEGTTDIIHLEMALAYFRSVGKFNDLDIKFIDITNNNKGWANMEADIKYESRNGSQSSDLRIFLFDRDEPNVIKNMTGDGARNYRRHSSGLYSLVLPKFEEGQDKLCIEYYYGKSQIESLKKQRKRLYLREEFQDRWHPTEHVILAPAGSQSGLIIEQGVYDGYTKEDLCLRKGPFAHLVRETKGIDFTRFEIVFKEICDIRENFYKNDVLKFQKG